MNELSSCFNFSFPLIVPPPPPFPFPGFFDPGSPPGAFKVGNAATVPAGFLELVTRYEPGYTPATAASDCDCEHADISTPLLVSSTKLQYGFYEIRAKVAAAPLLSSFWLQGDGGEINILDVSPGPDPSTNTPQSANGYHCFEPNPDVDAGESLNEQASTLISGFNPQTDFHTYGIERSVDGVDFYIDGVLVRQLKRSEVATDGCLDMPMSVVFSMETLASIGAPSDFDSYTTEVDYFRFWTSPDNEECNNDLVTFGDVQAGIRYATYANRIQTIRPANLAECQAACTENAECGFYTFKPDSGAGNLNNNGGCLLFPEGEGTKADIGYQSAVKLTDGCPKDPERPDSGGCSPDQVTFGDLMPNTRFAVFTENIGIFKGRTQENCAALCAHESGCGLYSHKSVEQNCLLFPAGLGTKGDAEFATAVRNPDSCMNAETYALASAAAAAAAAPLVVPTCASSGLSMFPTEQKATRVKNLKMKLARRVGVTLHDCFELCAGRVDCAQLSYNAASLKCFLFPAGLGTRSKGPYVTYERTCTTCVAGALFLDPMLSVRFEYAQLDRRLATNLLEMSAGQCLAWCAANDPCAMVTHDEGKQECIPFPSGVGTRIVNGYTTVRKTPGTCADSTERVAGNNYPQCLYEAATAGQFARFSLALQTWDKVGLKQCLAACASLSTCGKVAYKAATGKCLLYGPNEIMTRVDSAFASYVLKADAPPVEECHPPSGAIQRSWLADVSSFEDRMQKIKQERAYNLHEDKVSYWKDAAKILVIVVGGVMLTFGLLAKARNRFNEMDHSVDHKGYVLPPGTPDHESHMPIYGRKPEPAPDHEHEDEDVFTDVDAGLDSDDTTDSSFDSELNTSTDSTLSGITRAAMGAAALLYQKAARAPRWWSQPWHAPHAPHAPHISESGGAIPHHQPTTSNTSTGSLYGQVINLVEADEPSYCTNTNDACGAYQDFDVAAASEMFLTADNFRPNSAASPSPPRRRPAASAPLQLPLKKAAAAPSQRRSRSRRARDPATEITPLIAKIPLLDRSMPLSRNACIDSTPKSRDAVSASGSCSGEPNNRTADGFFGVITAGLSAFNLFSKEVDPKEHLLAIDRAVDAVVQDVIDGSRSSPNRDRWGGHAARSISDYEDEGGDADADADDYSETASGCYRAVSMSGVSEGAAFAVDSDGGNGDDLGTVELIRYSLESKVTNGKISMEEYEKILQVTSALEQDDFENYLNAPDSTAGEAAQPQKSTWNLVSWMGLN